MLVYIRNSILLLQSYEKECVHMSSEVKMKFSSGIFKKLYFFFFLLLQSFEKELCVYELRNEYENLLCYYIFFHFQYLLQVQFKGLMLLTGYYDTNQAFFFFFCYLSKKFKN